MSPWAVVSVLVVLGAFVALSWALRRRAFARTTGPGVTVISYRRLDFNASVWVVEVDGRRLLLGTGRDGASLLADLGEQRP